MTVDDHHTVVTIIDQKIVAYPTQIHKRLLFNRDAGTNTCMHKDVVAYCDNIFAGLKKLYMLDRHELGQSLRNLFKGCFGQADIVVPIAGHRGVAADPHEIAHATDIAGQGCQKTLFVISDKQPHVIEFSTQFDSAFNYMG